MMNRVETHKKSLIGTVGRSFRFRSFFPLIVLVILMALTGCGSSANAEEGGSTGAEHKEGIEIVTTIFPEYDWVREILGANPGDIHTTLLLDNGVDLHSFQPTAEDIMRISRCDIFIYVGGESDKWVQDALKEATNSEMTVINLMDILGSDAREEELVEGMQGEEEEEEGEEEEKEYDEHVWLSLRNAKKFTQVIEEKIAAKDPANKAVYEENLKNYTAKLDALDAEYSEAVKNAVHTTLVFADRFPFRYMIEDYKLSYYAAFIGCSAETEASFETVTFLAKKVDELGLKAVFVIEGSDRRIAETVKKNTKEKSAELLTLNSLQGTSRKDIDAGATYLSIMTDNLSVLKEGLK